MRELLSKDIYPS